MKTIAEMKRLLRLSEDTPSVSVLSERLRHAEEEARPITTERRRDLLRDARALEAFGWDNLSRSRGKECAVGEEKRPAGLVELGRLFCKMAARNSYGRAEEKEGWRMVCALRERRHN